LYIKYQDVLLGTVKVSGFWGDRWLPMPYSFKSIQPRVTIDPSMKVSILIWKRWLEGRSHSVFFLA